MESVAALAAIAAATDKIMSMLKSASNREWKGPLTQLLVWVVATVVVIISSHAALTEGLGIPGVGLALGALDWPSQVLLGVVVGSSGSLAYDFKKAIDNTDTANELRLK